MPDILEYAPPVPSPWPNRLARALTATLPSLAAALIACLLSTLTMHYFRAATGHPVLTGPPRGHIHQLWVGLIPFLLATLTPLAAWLWSIARTHRRDRLPVALLGLPLQSALWFAALLWLFRNQEKAFP